MSNTINPARLRHFIAELSHLLDTHPTEADLLKRAKPLLQTLVSHDDWLPPEFTQPSAQHYQQYLLHADSAARFSIVSFVWGPGQRTPIHDHRVWGLIGMLRGSEISQGFRHSENGELHAHGSATRLQPGEVEAVSPTIGDIHQVSNAFDDQVSISIHVYGANIGAVHRAVFSPAGEQKLFISGYSNTHLPNIWDLSKEKLSV